MSKLTESEKIKIVSEIFPKGGRPKLTDALEKVRELNGRLTDATCREVALHASKQELQIEVSRLESELGELATHRDNLYAANQRFAEDDREYRLEAIKAQNRLTNDNLHQSDIIDGLNKLVQSTKVELAAWIANPVNKGLDEHNKHLDTQLRTLFIQADEFKNQRNQLLEANARLARDIDRQAKVIQQLRGIVNNVRAELVKEKGKHDIRLIGAKQRITELEAALNYFNGLCQQGAPDLVGRLQAEISTLQGVLEEKDILIRKHEGQIQRLDFLLDAKVRANFDLSEKLSEFIIKSSKSPFTKLWNFLTKIR